MRRDDAVLLSASFVAMGYATSCIKHNTEAGITAATRGWGQVETVAFLVGAAERLEYLYGSLPDEVRDSAPGVWVYEVAEPLGAWFGDQLTAGSVPSVEEVDEFMIESIANFFTQCDGDRQPETKSGLVASLKKSARWMHGIVRPRFVSS